VFLYTPLYLVFLAVVCLVYWLLPRPAWRKTLLLLASYALYATFDARFLLVLLGITAANQRVLLHRARTRLRAALEDYYRPRADRMIP